MFRKMLLILVLVFFFFQTVVKISNQCLNAKLYDGSSSVVLLFSCAILNKSNEIHSHAVLLDMRLNDRCDECVQ